jgi:energy-coupling factor transporter ATP-binding protein EcfA2
VGARHLEDRLLATLSGGEKQKIAIAAMMAAQPQVLIFDEPTSNLDPTATTEIFGVIERIRAESGITVIVIEHKIDFLRRFRPTLVAMENGRVVFHGPLSSAALPADPAGYGGAEERQASRRPLPLAPADRPVVEVEDLHAGYGGQPVLQGVSLRVGAGEFVAVMGDNGSGKTTFMQCLLGLVKPESGRVQVRGLDTRTTPVSQMARHVGYVFQNPDHQLFADSVWEEAMFAPLNLARGEGRDLVEGTESRVRGLLDRSKLGSRRDDHPYRLSYGQKRRLNLVSVLSYDPQVILLDELLIGQDPANATFLLGLLRERAEAGAVVILVNHTPELTRCYATRLLFFSEGSIVVDAPVGEGFERLAAMGKHAYVD